MTNKPAVQDPLIDLREEFLANPYPTFASLREAAPVMWSEKGNYWLVSRYEVAHHILGDLHFEKGARRFKSVDMLAKILPGGAQLQAQRTGHILNSNPPDHTRMRALVNKAFTPARIVAMRANIESIANELIDAVVSKKRMDLMADFAFPLPAIVIAEMLGIPREDHNKFKNWSHSITAALDPNPKYELLDTARILLAYSQLQDYLRPIIEERRKEKREDLISALVAAEEAGDRLTTAELLSNIVLLLIAGHETTSNLIGNGVLALLRHADQLERLRADDNLLPNAVSECLRYDSPVQIVRRVAGEQLMVGDRAVQEGQSILILIGACNRDPAQFPEPDRFDINRSPNKHLAFGHGIHHCLGSSLAETEGAIAFKTLFTRLPRLKLAIDKIEYKHPFSLRSVKTLPVTW
jgi:cytochrome P450